MTALSMVAIASCTTPEERVVDEKLLKQGLLSRSQLQDEVKDSISGASDLSEQQRSDLRELQRSSTTEMDALINESLKLRSILVKDLLSPNYSASRTRTVEKRLKKIELERVDVLLRSIQQAHKILGAEAQAHEQVMHDLTSERPLRF